MPITSPRKQPQQANIFQTLMRFSSTSTTRTGQLLGVLLVVLFVTSCATTKRPTEPEYHGSVPIGDYDYVVDMDFCDDSWIMTLAKQVSRVSESGSHESIYGMVQNVVDAAVVTLGDTIYVSSPREGVLRSVNQGITFKVMPGLDTLGRIRSLVMYGNELLALRTDGTLLRSVGQRSWKQVGGTGRMRELFMIGSSAAVMSEDGMLYQLDLTLTRSSKSFASIPAARRFSISWDTETAVILADNNLYKFNQTPASVRVDSVSLPPEKEWRAVSVLGQDIVTLAGRNEVWWGTFDDPLQVRSTLAGENDKRIVSLDLSEIGVIAGFRGTEQSVFLNIKNSDDWYPVFRVTGQPVNDVIWTTRSRSTVFVGTRDGGMYQLSTTRRALLDVASPANELNILYTHGSYPDKLMTLFDGRIIHAMNCTSDPLLANLPVPFDQGVRVLDASGSDWYIQHPSQGLFVTHDRGSTWSTLKAPDSLSYVETLYALDDDVYIYGSRRLLHSADDGQSWAPVFPSDDTVYSAKRYGNELLVISHKGWSFVRGARIYDRITPPARSEDSRVFVFDAKDDILALLTESALYVSNDRGKRWGSLNMSRESMFPYVRIANDRVFAPLPGTGLMMFDVYSDRPGTPSNP